MFYTVLHTYLEKTKNAMHSSFIDNYREEYLFTFNFIHESAETLIYYFTQNKIKVLHLVMGEWYHSQKFNFYPCIGIAEGIFPLFMVSWPLCKWLYPRSLLVVIVDL